MKLAPPGETGNGTVRLKDVLNIRRGTGGRRPQHRTKSVEERRKLSVKCSGRVPWNKGRHLSPEHRDNIRKGQGEGEWHRPHIEMVLTGSCEGPRDCERERRGVGCADSWYVCPWFVFEGLAFYYCRPPSPPIALTPRKD